MAIDKSDPEVKTLIDEAVEAAEKGLKRKNDELMDELKDLRRKQGITPEQYQEAVDKNSALEARVVELERANKSQKADLDKAQAALESESKAAQAMVVDAGLAKAVTKIGVKSEFSDAVRALLSPLVEVKQDGESRIAVVGDKPLEDYAKEWAESDAGKHFIAADPNVGGGSPGGSPSGKTQKTMARTEFEAKSASEQMAFIKDGGKPVD